MAGDSDVKATESIVERLSEKMSVAPSTPQDVSLVVTESAN
jgi:hypothetical protein